MPINTNVVGTEQIGLGYLRRAIVLEIIIEKQRDVKIGCRTEDLVRQTELSLAAVQRILSDLEYLKLIDSRVLQVGTAGTTDRFFTPAEGANVVILGSPALNGNI